MRRPGSARTLLILLLGACIALQLALIPAPRGDGLLIGSDGIEHYAYLRSLVIDHDLDFRNEFAHYAAVTPTPPTTAIGRTANKHTAFGVALLWAPFFLAAHAVVLGLAAVGAPVAADGYNYVYQAAVCLGSAIYGAHGCLLAFAAARRYYPERPAALAVGVLWIASNASYYMVLEPSMPHMVSLFVVAGMLTLWLTRLRDVPRPALAVFACFGVLVGLVFTVRTQDAAFIGIPAAFIAVHLKQLVSARQRDDVIHWLRGLAIAAACAAALAAAQFYTWYAVYGIAFESPMQRDQLTSFTWLSPHLADVLWSWRRGLFTWHPVLLAATCGLALFQRRERWLAPALAVAWLVQVYVLAAWWAWWEGDAFGGRIFLNCFWLWAIGLSAVFTWIASHRRWWPFASGVSVLLVAWNALAVVQYRLGWMNIDAPSPREMTLGRLQVPLQLFNRVRGTH